MNLRRAVAAEFVGTAVSLATVVGSDGQTPACVAASKALVIDANGKRG